MARNTTKSSGNSRIRFVMLEAEIEDGDFSQITQAIQNALGPRKVVTNHIIKSSDPAQEFLEDAISLDPSDTEDQDSIVETSAPRREKSSTRRSFPTPEVVDIDWNTDPTVEQYVAENPPKSTTDKFLVVLSWFKEVVGEPAVTTNQVYTVFKKLKWPTAIKDFSQPLRDLKGQQVITGNAKQGFVINHLGSARVEEMKP